MGGTDIGTTDEFGASCFTKRPYVRIKKNNSCGKHTHTLWPNNTRNGLVDGVACLGQTNVMAIQPTSTHPATLVHKVQSAYPDRAY